MFIFIVHFYCSFFSLFISDTIATNFETIICFDVYKNIDLYDFPSAKSNYKTFVGSSRKLKFRYEFIRAISEVEAPNRTLSPWSSMFTS